MIWVNAVIAGVLLGGLYALFACGLSLMFGVMRIINLAHGDLAVLGAYLVLMVDVTFGVIAPGSCRSRSWSWRCWATCSSGRCWSAACAPGRWCRC